MRRLALLLGLLLVLPFSLASSPLAPEGWFTIESAPSGAEARVERATPVPGGIDLSVRVPGLITRTIETKAGPRGVLTIPEGGVTAETGHPRLPVLRTMVEVPPGGQRVLWVDSANNSLVPLDWEDPLEEVTGVQAQAVAAVEPWLQRDLASQLLRMGSNGNRFAQLIRDCSEPLWVDEIAFSVAHTPVEELNLVTNVNVRSS